MSASPYLPWQIMDDVFGGAFTSGSSSRTYSVNEECSKSQSGREEKDDNECDNGAMKYSQALVNIDRCCNGSRIPLPC